MKIIFLFVDGVGIRPPAPDNPVNPEVCPTLCRLIARSSVPIDACLGVPGLPQSATGQSTMFTGTNMSKAMGRHCEGFPPPSLRQLIERDNLFLQLKKRGKRFKFADAYLVDDADELALLRFKSVTTVMALTTPEAISTVSDLQDDNAVMQDLTRAAIQNRRPDIPPITPKDAAEHLFALSRGYDFTLFEFFQTDVAGHTMDYDRACAVLRTYDLFLATLTRLTKATGITLMLTADHGNIEAMSEHTHTKNPVPFVVFGPGEAESRANVKSLTDVTPTILRLYD